MDSNKIYTLFKERFEGSPILSVSPGRINLIGEHTDYNQGFVLPGAIDKKIYFAIALNNTDNINIYSANYESQIQYSLPKLGIHNEQWGNYLTGTILEMQNIKHFELKGFDCVFGGNVPTGAGLSSSAALETGFAVAINELFRAGLTSKEIILASQLAEHNYVGTKCGIMDQFSSMMGKKDHVFKLDCRSLDFEYFPLQMEEYQFVLINSNVKHSLVSSEYNTRRQECIEGVNLLKHYYQDIISLRDVSIEMLEKHRQIIPPNIYSKCKYVVEENNRVLKFCNLLKSNNIEDASKILFEGHDGLSKDYEVSCTETDFLVEQAKKLDYIIGARMMGGGFGGCTINVIKKGAFDKLKNEFSKSYSQAFSILPEFYEFTLEDGAHII